MRSMTRKSVLAALANVTSGAIRVEEPGRVHEFGEPFEFADLRATIRVHDRRFWRKVALGGSVGAGDSYAAGLWSCDDLANLVRILLRNQAALHAVNGPLAACQKAVLRTMMAARRNSVGGARRNVRAHYDLGNRFFELFLDETMTYSAALFPAGSCDLRLAQDEKHRLLCERLQLSPEDHLLEIGSGWGAMAIYAAQHYGCRVTTTTISERQFEHASRRIAQEGLQDRITILLSDYRELRGRYDKLVSVEMLEAVGPQYLAEYFASCARLLKDTGLAAFQLTTMLDAPYQRAGRAPDFIAARVFPGSHVPSFACLYDAIRRADGFRLYDYQEQSSHYVDTLRAWRERFGQEERRIRALGFSETFMRTWDYYLAYCQGAFEERYINCGQLILARQRHLGANLPALPTSTLTQNALPMRADRAPSTDPPATAPSVVGSTSGPDTSTVTATTTTTTEKRSASATR